ncbi:carbohydrate kinase family protein [Paroceanicella profunda]|nr:carbohydrate kinase [Paroceanicella profunda]
MFLICGEALFDVYVGEATSTGVMLDARIGGSPYNVAMGLSRMGRTAGLLTGNAQDSLGARLMKAATEEGMDTRFLRPKPALTTLALIGVAPSGAAQYSFYSEGSVDWAITEADLPRLDDIKAVHVGSYSLVLEPSGSSFLTLARQARGTQLVSLDPNIRLGVVPDRARWQERIGDFLRCADLVKVSDEDLAVLCPGKGVETAARDWLAIGPKLVVVTLGAEGALAVSDSHMVRVPGKAVRVEDTVGAGDTFQAALLTALDEMGHASPSAIAELSAETISRALVFAVEASAITCQRRGADLPHRHLLPALL